MTDLNLLGAAAQKAALALAATDTATKNRALTAMAEALRTHCDAILKANEQDLQSATEKGVSPVMADRLRLTRERIFAMAHGMEKVAALPDPVGELLDDFTRPNGLRIRKIRVPIGVIAMIYESRPNVTADAAALCFKTSNAVILKGGSDALRSNIAIADAMRGALAACGLPADAVQLITDTDRAVTTALMRLNDYVDVLIPRGSGRLIQSVLTNATVPVIETGVGNCHVYIDSDADIEKGVQIIVNAKAQRPSVCNAAETLLVHTAIADAFLPRAKEALDAAGVTLRGCEKTRQYIDVQPADETDYATEFLDLILAARVVDSIEAAMAHIARYGTKHSECIVTENTAHAAQFLHSVDAAVVYANASTRFTDGEEFGFGAEIGISTQKLHARGPMGLCALTSYKYTVEGDGQIR